MLKHFFHTLTKMWLICILFLVLQISTTVNAKCKNNYYSAKENGNCYRPTNLGTAQTPKEVITSCDNDQAYLPVIRNEFDSAMIRGFADIKHWPILMGYSKVSGAWKWDYPGVQSTYVIKWAEGDVKDKSDYAYMNKDGTFTTVAPVAPNPLQTVVCQTVNSISMCTPKSPANIVDAYYLYNNQDQRCYWFTRNIGGEEPVARNLSAVFCKQNGGSLAKISTPEENEFMASLYPSSTTQQPTNGPAGWIGLTFVAKDNKFVWDDGTDLDTTYINFDIIDHTKGTCVSMSYEPATYGKWQMNDCTDTLYLTCQTGAMATTSTTPKPAGTDSSTSPNPRSSLTTIFNLNATSTVPTPVAVTQSSCILVPSITVFFSLVFLLS